MVQDFCYNENRGNGAKGPPFFLCIEVEDLKEVLGYEEKMVEDGGNPVRGGGFRGDGPAGAGKRRKNRRFIKANRSKRRFQRWGSAETYYNPPGLTEPEAFGLTYQYTAYCPFFSSSATLSELQMLTYGRLSITIRIKTKANIFSMRWEG